MSDDAKLLQDYAEERSEKAFAELVDRHLTLVYRAALRQLGGDAHRAQDVTQVVFTDLARKAGSLAGRPVLAGWLYTSTRYAAAQAVRSEQRRRAREEKAQIMDELLSNSAPVPDWNQLRPVIDDALHRLNDRDREAVLLRFFEGKPFAEIGAQLAVSEDAARVRVDRALDKLRTLLSRRGVTSTSAALATLLANEALAGAPAGLAMKITAGAVATGGATAVSTFIGMTKLQLGLASVVAVGGGVMVVQQQQAQAALRTEIGGLRQQQHELAVRAMNERDGPVPGQAEVERIQSELTDLAKLRAELAILQEKKEETDSYRARLARELKPLEDLRRREKLSYLPPTPDPRFGMIYSPFDLDERPEPLKMMEPKITPALLAAFQERDFKGTAHAIVDPTGKPCDITVTDATSPEFAAAIAEAVSHWEFRPGMLGGKPVATRIYIPFRRNKTGTPTASSTAKR